MDELWRLPSTPVDRGLALWNLKRGGRFHEIRVSLARRYHDNLKSARDILRTLHTDAASGEFPSAIVPGSRLSGVRKLAIGWQTWVPICSGKPLPAAEQDFHFRHALLGPRRIPAWPAASP
jgi:hypothetical protein